MAKKTKSKNPNNETIIKAFIECEFSHDKTAKKLGLSRSQFYLIRKNRPNLAKALKDCHGDYHDILLDLARDGLSYYLKKKHWPAIKFVLERIGGYNENLNVTQETNAYVTLTKDMDLKKIARIYEENVRSEKVGG